MSWISRNRHWILLALVAVTTVLALGTVGVGLLVVLAGLASGAGVGAVLGDAALALLIAALLVAADTAFALGFLVTVARRVPSPSLPENERAAETATRLERAVPQMSRLELSERFAVSTEKKRERLKQRYVDDELTQVEYERRLQALLAEETGDETVSDVDELDADLAVGRTTDRDDSVSGSGGENRDLAAIDSEREYS